jgi:hypothetical protein
MVLSARCLVGPGVPFAPRIVTPAWPVSTFFRRLAVGVLVVAAWGCSGSHVYRIPIDKSAPFAESIALTISLQAHSAAGFAASQVEPVCYWDCGRPEKYFARNSSNTESGYTLWRIKESTAPGTYHLSVHLKRQGATVECEVSRVK